MFGRGKSQRTHGRAGGLRAVNAHHNSGEGKGRILLKAKLPNLD